MWKYKNVTLQSWEMMKLWNSEKEDFFSKYCWGIMKLEKLQNYQNRKILCWTTPISSCSTKYINYGVFNGWIKQSLMWIILISKKWIGQKGGGGHTKQDKVFLNFFKLKPLMMPFHIFIAYLVVFSLYLAIPMRKNLKRVNRRRNKILLILIKVDKGEGGCPRMWKKIP